MKVRRIKRKPGMITLDKFDDFSALDDLDDLSALDEFFDDG